jgi:hypothetical protein
MGVCPSCENYRVVCPREDPKRPVDFHVGFSIKYYIFGIFQLDLHSGRHWIVGFFGGKKNIAPT